MKRERILPCVKHPKAFWPWDKPRPRNSVIRCPLCEKDFQRIRRDEFAKIAARSAFNEVEYWNKNNEA